MSVIDAHQHLWNLDRVSYPWLTAEAGALYRSFTEQEVEPQMAAAGIDRTVLVQSADSYEDTDFMIEVANRWPRVAGIVGWVPLREPAEAATALGRYQVDRRFVGVRHLIHTEPDPDWLLDDAVQDGLALLAEQGLTFDVVAVSSRHLEHVSTIAERHPHLRLVIDHLAKPPIAERGWQPWSTLMGRAAAHPNVFAKISGLNTAADPQSWTARDLQPYIDHALEVFGAERLMFGGDWPVTTLAGDYAKVWQETNIALASLDDAARLRILGGTAIDFYRLQL